MAEEKLDKYQKKQLTNSDKADMILRQLKVKAQLLAGKDVNCKVYISQEGNISRIEIWPPKETIA